MNVKYLKKITCLNFNLQKIRFTYIRNFIEKKVNIYYKIVFTAIFLLITY